MIKKGKWTVIITWWSNGIGAGFAREFAEAWYDLLLVSKDKHQMTTFVKYLKILFPIKISSMIFDLSKPAQLEQLIAEIAKINDLEMVINCTEYGTSKKEFYKDNQTSEDISNIDTITHMKFSHQTLNIMKKRKHGIIIHVSWLATILNIWDNPVYAASKIFFNNVWENFNHLYKDFGVSIQLLCPWFTDTDMPIKHLVKSSLSCIKTQKIICIPGWKNNLILMMYHLLPKTRSHKIFNKYK